MAGGSHGSSHDRRAILTWIAGFKAAAAAAQAAERRGGPDGNWASVVSLSMISAARAQGVGPRKRDRFREKEVETVRRTWARLRRRLRVG